MISFFNSLSRPLILSNQFKGHSLEVSDKYNLGLLKSFFPFEHFFNLPHYFSSDKSIKLSLNEFEVIPNTFTMYLNLHPLQEIRILKFDDFAKLYKNSFISFLNSGNNYVINLEKFSTNQLSKSVKQKISKYFSVDISTPSIFEFNDIFNKFFLYSPPYDINFKYKKNYNLYKASSASDSVYIMTGEPLASESQCAEYLFSCSNNSSARNLTSAAIFHLIFILKEKGYKFFNLGGGVKPGDNIEIFKSWFGGVAIPSVRCRFVSDMDKFSSNGGFLHEGFFPSYRNPII